jgi:hypothetical protein
MQTGLYAGAGVKLSLRYILSPLGNSVPDNSDQTPGVASDANGSRLIEEVDTVNTYGFVSVWEE